MASKLEQIAIDTRKELLVKNENYDLNGPYSEKHHRALSDDGSSPEHGRGNGEFLGIDSIDGVGTKTDIVGNPKYQGSGRKPALAANKSKWGYGPDAEYGNIDTSGNVGQFSFGS